MNKNLEEISDGKRYGLNDMVRAACNDCAGCSSCCEDMGESIILDPLDIYELTKNLNTTFENLLKEQIELHVADGMILPNLKMTDKDVCPFYKRKDAAFTAFDRVSAVFFHWGGSMRRTGWTIFTGGGLCQKRTAVR